MKVKRAEIENFWWRKSKNPPEYYDISNSIPGRGPVGRGQQLDVHVIESRKKKLGEDHPDTLSSTANLAFTWKSAGRKATAINLLRICVAKQQLIIGPGHPHTVSNSNTLLEWKTEELGTVEFENSLPLRQVSRAVPETTLVGIGLFYLYKIPAYVALNVL